MNLSIYRNRFAGIVGNFLGHYDNALFGLISPFIALLFFEGKDYNGPNFPDHYNRKKRDCGDA